MSEAQVDEAVEKPETFRTARTVPEELQHSIAQALADQTTALVEAKSGLGGDQKRVAWCI